MKVLNVDKLVDQLAEKVDAENDELLEKFSDMDFDVILRRSEPKKVKINKKVDNKR